MGETTTSTPPEPPSALRLDEPDAVQDARQRFEQRSTLQKVVSSLSLRRVKSKTSPLKRKTPHARRPTPLLQSSLPESPVGNQTTEDIQALTSSASTSAQPMEAFEPNSSASRAPTRQNTIVMDDSGLYAPEDSKSEYVWAIVYENQRGITLFSTPYYSKSSLLPFDPEPFTSVPNPFINTPTPSNGKGKPKTPSFASLHNYTLPSGSWSWVSKAWMIDMRSTSPSLAGRQANTVQYDGFEYNSVFRQNGWKAETGKLSAGGYVRRRRWVRLMVRQARTVPVMDQMTDGVGTNAPSMITQPSRTRGSSSVYDEDVMAAMWDGTGGDLRRCVRAMNMAGRDGTKIELWARWLGLEPRSSDKRKWTEDRDQDQGSGSLTPQSSSRVILSTSPSASAIMLAMSAPSREHLSSLLRNHGTDVLQLFIYPESRAQFMDLLEEAGLSSCIDQSTLAELGFWSYERRLSAVSNLRLQAHDGSRSRTGSVASSLAVASSSADPSPATPSPAQSQGQQIAALVKEGEAAGEDRLDAGELVGAVAEVLQAKDS